MRDYIEELDQIIGPVWTALIMFSTAFIIAIIAVFALVCVGVGVEVLMDKRKKRKQAERVKRY